MSRLTVMIWGAALLPALSVAVAVSVLAPGSSGNVQPREHSTLLTLTLSRPEPPASEDETVTLAESALVQLPPSGELWRPSGRRSRG